MDTTLADPLLGVVLDRRYRVEAVLAHGGMSTVYFGEDLRLDRPVAIKVMSPSFAKDPGFVEQFTREARAAARLSHPNVVAVHDQGQDGEHVFLVMELVRGRTLRQLLRERGRFTAPLAVSVLEPVLAALAVAHRAGLVHCDVKPENVLISTDGVVKVADFGLARAVASATPAHTAAVMGTAAYVAPEVVADGTADARSDVYSAGVMLYEMLTGAPPYLGENAASVASRHVHEDVPPPSVSAPDTPPPLASLTLRATRRSPEARPADAGAFLAELHDVRARLRLRPVPVPHARTPASVGTGAARPGPVPLNRTRLLHAPLGAATHDTRYTGPPDRPRSSAVPHHDEQRAHRRRGIAALVTVVLLGVLAAGAGWSYGVWRYTTVPVLKGMTRAEAVARARAAHLQVRSATAQVFDDEVRSGLVAGSRPGQGHRIARGGTLTLLISKGPAPRRIPDLVGQSPDEATRALSDLKLHATTGEAYSDVPEGRVAGTDPTARATVAAGSTVTVLISRGPLPDTTGRLRGPAVQVLRNAGLTVRVDEEFSDDVAEGIVIRQEPSGGTVRPGATVTVVVSKGPRTVRVPNVIGKNVDDARAQLEELGFHVEVQSLFGAQAGIVIAQTPVVGVERRPGSTVRLGVI